MGHAQLTGQKPIGVFKGEKYAAQLRACRPLVIA